VTSSKPLNLDTLPKAREELKKGKVSGMMKFRLDVLQALCKKHGISYARKNVKVDLAQRLVRGPS